jgi:hypothetical protein
MTVLAMNRVSQFTGSDDRARRVAQAARDRLKAIGAWETEEEAEREVRRRSGHAASPHV